MAHGPHGRRAGPARPARRRGGGGVRRARPGRRSGGGRRRGGDGRRPGSCSTRAARPSSPRSRGTTRAGASRRRAWPSDLGASFAERTGLPVRPLCSLVKYAWMREHWPDASRGVRWLSVVGVDRARARRRRGRGVLARLPHRVLRPAHAAAVGRRRWRGRAPPPASRPSTSPRARRSASPTARSPAPGSHARGRRPRPPRGGGRRRASRGTARCSTRGAPPRRGSAPPRPLTPEQVRDSVAAGLTVGWHAIEGRQALLGAARSGAALQAVLDLLGVTDRADARARGAHADPGGLSARTASSTARSRSRGCSAAPRPRRSTAPR